MGLMVLVKYTCKEELAVKRVYQDKLDKNQYEVLHYTMTSFFILILSSKILI